MKGKGTIQLVLLILIACESFLFSCGKEYSCENCAVSKPPIAIAGKDTIINLPIDSVNIDGTLSYDPNGTIKSFGWKKISGPASFTIINVSTAKTTIKNLTAGAYQFQLKVTDNSGLSATDTLQVIVNDPLQPNRPPVANAGIDQTITLPVNSITLNGSSSTDPDNNIITYAWKQIAGPVASNITTANAIQTKATNLVQGTYQFELQVTDAGGVFSKDTVQVIVTTFETTYSCNDRPIINASLVPVGQLSQHATIVIPATAANKILFASGIRNGGYSSRVDIYDFVANTWATAELTIADRQGMAAASVGNKILFAGGGNNDVGIVTSRVDIYDASTNTWSTAELSKAREYLAATTIGNKVFFAGGGNWEPYYTGLKVVDIYDNSTNTWAIDSISEGRSGMAANTVGNKVYFAGGFLSATGSTNASATIDIFDTQSSTWSTSSLQEAKASMASIAVGNKIYWGTGITSPNTTNGALSTQVEIRDVASGTSSFACMIPRYSFNAVLKGDNIIFFTGSSATNFTMDHFEIYNLTTSTWATAVLNQKVYNTAIICANNTIYVAGGTDENTNDLNQVWKLEF